MKTTERIPLLCAPMQGVTTHVWRMAHREVFGGVEAYYTPFMRVERGAIMSRDLRDVSPENNAGIPIVPQILACKPQEALLMVEHLKTAGYSHININLGCPHPPIALKHKGSGMLAYPQEVKTLFESLAQEDKVAFSVKMRLGWDCPGQWRDIVPLFPILKPEHITVHPRIGRQQYKGDLYLNEFEEFVKSVDFPIVYNGDISSPEEAEQVAARLRVKAVMVGRALVADPAFAVPELATSDHYRRFHHIIYDAYCRLLNGGDHVILSRMKALWEYFLPNADHRDRKAIKKASNRSKYDIAVEELFAKEINSNF